MKISFIAEGGGMRGAYVYGAIMALSSMSKKFSFDDIDYFCASSASVPTLFYYLGGQFFTDGFDIWVNNLVDKDFLDSKRLKGLFAGKPILDITYLCDEIFKGKHPLNIDKIKKSKKIFFVPVVNSDTGELEFFVNSDNKFRFDNVKFNDWRDCDLYKFIGASTAAPIAFDKSYTINGSHYVDGGLFDPPAIEIPLIKDSKRIVLLTRAEDHSKDYSFSEEVVLDFLSMFSKKNKHINRETYKMIKKKELEDYRDKEKEYEKLADKGEIILLRPSENIDTFDNNVETLSHSIVMGFEDTLERIKDIEKFLFK